MKAFKVWILTTHYVSVTNKEQCLSWTKKKGLKMIDTAAHPRGIAFVVSWKAFVACLLSLCSLLCVPILQRCRSFFLSKRSLPQCGLVEAPGCQSRNAEAAFSTEHSKVMLGERNEQNSLCYHFSLFRQIHSGSMSCHCRLGQLKLQTELLYPVSDA